MAVSSGTSAVGLWKGLQKLYHPGVERSGAIGSPGDSTRKLQNDGAKLPQLHIVQTTKVHPIASDFDKDFTSTKTSIASAIVDRVAHRKDQVINAVKESGGWGWVVGDEEIENSRLQIADLMGIKDISAESAMSLAGLKKAITHTHELREPIVLIFSGK